MIESVCEGVFVAEHSMAEGKNPILIGARRSCAVDCGTYEHEGRVVADFLQSRGHVPDLLLLTHGHYDHVLGCTALCRGEVIASRKTLHEMEAQIDDFADRTGEDVSAIRQRLPWPTIVFEDRLTLDLGDMHVELFPTPGHSHDAVSGFIPERELVLAADTVVTAIPPAIFYSSTELEASIRSIRALDPAILISGHGPVLKGRKHVRSWLDFLVDYLSGVRSKAESLLAAGVDPERIIAEIEFDAYIGKRLDADKFDMPERHRNVVRKIVDELQSTSAG